MACSCGGLQLLAHYGCSDNTVQEFTTMMLLNMDRNDSFKDSYIASYMQTKRTGGGRRMQKLLIFANVLRLIQTHTQHHCLNDNTRHNITNEKEI